jgi:uncharacterized protein
MIPRLAHAQTLTQLLGQFPVVAILGARQVGKTTLARLLVDGHDGPTTWFDLENPAHLARLAEPQIVLERLEGLVVIDEVQRLPDLFPLLRVLVDRPADQTRFLLAGSASPDLLRQSSETLAGRIAYHVLDGLDLDEVGWEAGLELWCRGGFPRSFLAEDDSASLRWREDFIQTFLERDVPQLGIAIPATTLRRFWTMLAHYHGQVWNGSEFARSFGVSDKTVRRYLDVLSDTYVAWQLQPWYENLGKRQVRSPKVYLRDSGLLHALLGLETLADLESHPKVGSSWEGFAAAQVIQHLGVPLRDCYFWATHAGAELDLLVVRGNRRLGFEFKRTAAPRRTRSMTIALEDLGLESISVIYPGEEVYPLADRIQAMGLGSELRDFGRM